MRRALVSTYVCLVFAMRLREGTDLVVVSAHEEFTSLIAPDDLGSSSSVGTQASAEEIQRGLLDFLKQAQTRDLPKFQQPNGEYTQFLNMASRKWGQKTQCQQQLGSLVEELTNACLKIIKRKHREDSKGRYRYRTRRLVKHLSDVPLRSCQESAQDLFLYGKKVVEAQQVGDDFAKDAPRRTKPLLQAGLFLKEWILELASAKVGILWAGFWTNANLASLSKILTNLISLKPNLQFVGFCRFQPLMCSLI